MQQWYSIYALQRSSVPVYAISTNPCATHRKTFKAYHSYGCYGIVGRCGPVTMDLSFENKFFCVFRPFPSSFGGCTLHKCITYPIAMPSKKKQKKKRIPIKQTNRSWAGSNLIHIVHCLCIDSTTYNTQSTAHMGRFYLIFQNQTIFFLLSLPRSTRCAFANVCSTSKQ